MPLRVITTLAATAIMVVLLISFRTPPAAPITAAVLPGSTAAPTRAPGATPSRTPAAGGGTPTPRAARPTPGRATPAPTSTATPPGTTSLADGSFTGKAVYIYYGNVQLQLVVSGGRIATVRALQYPNDNPQSSYINSQALPLLRSEVLKIQGSRINGVSGATYTSYGFYYSLLSALKKAHA